MRGGSSVGTHAGSAPTPTPSLRATEPRSVTGNTAAPTTTAPTTTGQHHRHHDGGDNDRGNYPHPCDSRCARCHSYHLVAACYPPLPQPSRTLRFAAVA